MKTAQWSPASGEQHLATVQLLAGRQKIHATHSAALNLALSGFWAAERLLMAAGIRPAMPNLGISLPGDAQLTVFGAGVSYLERNKGDLRWPAAGPYSARHTAAMHYLATQRAIRALAGSSRPSSAAPDLTDPPVQLGGALGVVVVGVVVVAAIAAYTWRDVQLNNKVAELDASKAGEVARIKTFAELASAEIAAGRPVSIAPLVEQQARDELRRVQWGPVLIAGGAGLVVGGAVATWRAWRSEARS